MQRKNIPDLIALFMFVLLVLGLSGCMHGPANQTAGGSPYAVELWARDHCPDVGQTITLRATVTNVSSQTHTVDLGNQPFLDIVVGDQANGQRWVNNE